MSNYQPLNTLIHSNLRLKPFGGYAFAMRQHTVSIVLHEFAKAAVSYPIVFVKDNEIPKIYPVALVGLEPSKNLFVDDEGRWLRGHYVPAAFRRHPFALTQTSDGPMAVCVDIDSPFIQTIDGERLFNDDGSLRPTMEKINQFLQELMLSEVQALEFSQYLLDKNLLAPCEFKVKGPEGYNVYGGSFVIDEKKLDSLNQDEFIDLREKGYLVPIYSHLFSLMQVEKFVALRDTGI